MQHVFNKYGIQSSNTPITKKINASWKKEELDQIL